MIKFNVMKETALNLHPALLKIGFQKCCSVVNTMHESLEISQEFTSVTLTCSLSHTIQYHCMYIHVDHWSVLMKIKRHP